MAKIARAAGEGQLRASGSGLKCMAKLTRRQSPTLNPSGEVTVLDREPGTRGNVAAGRARRRNSALSPSSPPPMPAS